MKDKKIKLGLILLLTVTITSCMGKKKFDWKADTSAPMEYPIEVFEGSLGGYYFSEMGGFSHSGWGSRGGGMSEVHEEAPEILKMTWLSLAEGKFYTGNWVLPQEKMQQLFEEGFYNGPPDRHSTYTDITIGLAPKGVVVVWMTGVGLQVEIGRYQAHETTIDPKNVYENAKYMFKEGQTTISLAGSDNMISGLKEKIITNGRPDVTVYDTYREKYLWKPKVILPEGSVITTLYIKACNGEKEDRFEKPIELKQRAIPYYYEIVWNDKNGQRYVSRIAFTRNQKYWADALVGKGNGEELPLDFDKNEIRGIFKTKIDKNIPAEMVIKIDPTKDNDNEWVTDFYLQQTGKQYPLKEINQDSGKY
ncbi:DUF2931 family protein [Flavobacterium sp. LS1R49]|uniref:DUF2931 family protein n=1 Tax=Flavobacterium shii TaxID=2987687 RepID=A0A9X3C889_9FLAO|nr:DUF2931 family protein [Flavobacterium shii]MCV9930583.1 DUF2931 family protein [Flavobacterium shii]